MFVESSVKSHGFNIPGKAGSGLLLGLNVRDGGVDVEDGHMELGLDSVHDVEYWVLGRMTESVCIIMEVGVGLRAQTEINRIQIQQLSQVWVINASLVAKLLGYGSREMNK